MPFPPIDPATAAAAIGPVALKVAKKWYKKYTSKDHGSKVKKGEFAEASIEMFGDKACIQLDEKGSRVLLLTADNVQSYRFVEKKYKKLKLKDYYYYEITFKDGSESYVRRSKKYRDAMERYA